MQHVAYFEMMRLASSALPIGGFSYSQGLETAIEIGWVADELTMTDWLQDCLAANVGQFEAPIFWAIAHAQRRGATIECERLNELYLASRESSELLGETQQMGYSLLRLLAARHSSGSDRSQAKHLLESDRVCSLAWAWALAADEFNLNPGNALNAYLWSWAENQVAAAIKAIPLGQQSGQRILDALTAPLARTAQHAHLLPEAMWSNFAPGFAAASCLHETQYSRLFRS